MVSTIPTIRAPSTPDYVAEAVERERQRLLAKAGLNEGPKKHFKRPAELPFTKKDRETNTVLFGGFTLRHERLLQAAMGSLGYNLSIVPTPIKADFQAGKEYGNNGQCNPTYFTVGALVAFHTAHKMALLAHSETGYRELGRLVATAASLPRAELRRRYQSQFMAVLAKVATRGRQANVLMHMLGHLRERLDARDRAELLGLIEKDHRS